MGPDAAPDDVRRAEDDLFSVLEGRAAVGGEGDLPDVRPALHSLDTEPGRKRGRCGSERGDERREHRQERGLEFTRQATKLAVEAREALEGRHL